MPAQPKKAFALRLDPALYAAVERIAAAELRSANAEIEVLLREALARRGVTVKLPAPARRGRPPKEESRS
ncbi:toxin-antitoxin system HicB family antitoxin [Sphingopyxis panaciterrae]